VGQQPSFAKKEQCQKIEAGLLPVEQIIGVFDMIRLRATPRPSTE
jgi:hypothetical protein